MSLARIFVVGSFFLFIGCSTSPYAKRDIANVPAVPAECSLQVSNVIQQVTSTVSSDSTLLSAKAICQNGAPSFRTVHPNGRVILFNLPPSGQTGEAGFALVNEQGTMLSSQEITFPAGTNVESRDKLLRLVFNDFSVDFAFDRANLEKLRQACLFLNRPLAVGGTPPTGATCPMNYLSTSPITRFSHNGTTLNPTIAYSCRGAEPRYKISMATSGVLEEIELGASDGTYASAVSFRRVQRGYRGTPQRTSVVTGTHQKNTFGENRLQIRARNQDFVVEFDAETLARHQQWCAIASQSVETVPTPGTPAQVAPAEGAETDAVILQ